MSGVEGKAEMFPLGESITGFDPQQMWSPKSFLVWDTGQSRSRAQPIAEGLV